MNYIVEMNKEGMYSRPKKVVMRLSFPFLRALVSTGADDNWVHPIRGLSLFYLNLNRT
jgi:hypothetical protein